jgi:hypothetical protein
MIDVSFWSFLEVGLVAMPGTAGSLGSAIAMHSWFGVQ